MEAAVILIWAFLRVILPVIILLTLGTFLQKDHHKKVH